MVTATSLGDTLNRWNAVSKIFNVDNLLKANFDIGETKKS